MMDERSKSSSNLNGTPTGWRAWLSGSKKEPDTSSHHWTPDQWSCYECQAQFSLFTRRYFCGLCGRGFCSKCTKHTLPLNVVGPSGDESANHYKSDGENGAQTRVCNFCFDLRQKHAKTEGGRHSLDSTDTDGGGRHSPLHSNGYGRPQGEGGSQSQAMDISEMGNWRRQLPAANGGAHGEDAQGKERAVSPGDYGSR
jgi:hypothetical protein